MLTTLIILSTLNLTMPVSEALTPERLREFAPRVVSVNVVPDDTVITVNPPDGTNGTSPGGSKFVHLPCADNMPHPGYGKHIMMLWSVPFMVDPTRTTGDSVTWDMNVDVLDVIDSLSPMSSQDFVMLYFQDENNQLYRPDEDDPESDRYLFADRMRTQWKHISFNLGGFITELGTSGIGEVCFFFMSISEKCGRTGLGSGFGLDNLKIYDDGILVLQHNFEDGLIAGKVLEQNEIEASNDTWCVISKFIYDTKARSAKPYTWQQLKGIDLR